MKIQKEDEKQAEINENKMTIKQAEDKLIDKAKANLQEYLDKRIDEFADELSNLISTQEEINGIMGGQANDKSKGFSTLQIISLIKQPRYVVGKAPKYSAEELALTLEAYYKLVIYANRFIKFKPSKESFCRLAGISTSTFDSYLRSDDSDKREITQMILDYIRDSELTLAQHGEIKEITTIYRSKSTLGLVEQQAPQVIVTVDKVDIEEAKNKLESLYNKYGKPNNSLEISRDAYKIQE